MNYWKNINNPWSEEEEKEYKSIKHDTSLMLTGLKYGTLIMLGFTIFSTILFLIFPTVSASVNDLDYNFTEGVLFDGELGNAEAIFNIRNQTPYCHYDGTYPLDNNTLPNDWYVYEGGGSIEIIDVLDGHCSVIEMLQTDPGDDNIIEGYVDSIYGIENGTIEFWFYTNDSSQQTSFQLIQNAPNKYVIYVDSGYFKYYDGASEHNIVSASSNTWYPISIQFDCSDDWFNITIDGTVYGDYEARGTPSVIYNLQLMTGVGYNNYYAYFDAIGSVGYNDYNLGDYLNVYPFDNGTQETDKFEWAFDETGSPNNIGDDNLNGWTEVENDYFGVDSVSCSYSDDSADKSYWIHRSQLGNSGFYRDFGVSSGDHFEINISCDMFYSIYSEPYSWGFGHPDSWIEIDIASYDSTGLYSIVLNGSGNSADSLSYWDGVHSYPYPLNDSLPFGDWNLYIYWDSSGDGYIEFNGFQYDIDPLYDDKPGLGLISIYAQNPNSIIYGDMDYFIDSVGIYVDGVSLSDEGTPENVYILSGVNEWDFSIHNFIEFEFNDIYDNNISVSVNGDYEIIGYNDSYALDYLFFNLYNATLSYNGPFFQINNGSESWEIENVKIWGIALDLDGDLIYPELEYNNVDQEESYFYISGSNLAYYYTANDSETEYIEAIFDIDNVLCENRSLSGGSYISNNEIYGQTQVNYVDGVSSVFTAESRYTSYNVVLPQEKVIKTFTFVVSDNDEQEDLEVNGYFTSFSLNYNPSIGLSLTITSLLVMIVPLIVILAPSLAIFGFLQSRDKEIAKQSLIPMIILMSLICLITSLIEGWMFFIIALIGGGLILLSRRKGGSEI